MAMDAAIFGQNPAINAVIYGVTSSVRIIVREDDLKIVMRRRYEDYSLMIQQLKSKPGEIAATGIEREVNLLTEHVNAVRDLLSRYTAGSSATMWEKFVKRTQRALLFETMKRNLDEIDADVMRQLSFMQAKRALITSDAEVVQRADSKTSDTEAVLTNLVDTVQGGIRETRDRLEEVADTVRVGFDDLRGGMTNVAKSVQESVMRIKNLQAWNYLYPHLVVIKEIKTPSKRGWRSKLRGIARKDMTLHFLCPVDMSEVPCGVDGEGYRFRETRNWVKKMSPVLEVAVVTAKVALKATLGVGLDVEVSGFLQAVKDDLVEEIVDRTIDQEELFRVVSGEEIVTSDIENGVRASYDALKTFMDKEKRRRRKNVKNRDCYITFENKMTQVPDGKGGLVWVRNENVEKWRDSLSVAPAPSSHVNLV